MSFTSPDVPPADDDSEEFQRHLAEFLETNAPEDGVPVGTALGSVEDTSPQLPAPDPAPEADGGEGSPGSPQESEEGGVASSPGSTPPPPPLEPPAPDEEIDRINFALGDETEILSDGSEPPAPEGEPTSDPAPTPPPVDYQRVFNAYFPDVEFTADHLVELLDFGTRVQQLSPERQRILNAAFADDPSAFLGLTQQNTPPATPPPAQVRQQPVDPWNDDPEPIPAGPDPHVAALEARLAQMEQAEQQRAIAQQEAQIQYETDLAGQGYVAFREQYASLDDTDLAILKADVTKKGLYPALLRANNGDPRAAYQAALETAMATNPSYKGHLISGAQPTAQQAAPPTPEEETRATLASAVSGSTSSPLSKIEQPAPPKDDAEMKQQIKAELDRVVNANT